MQMAEGPKGFLQGYEEMMEKYSDDAARKKYIKELFTSPQRHHFSRALRFVITGVCTSSVSPHHAKQLTSPRPCLYYTSFVNADGSALESDDAALHTDDAAFESDGSAFESDVRPLCVRTRGTTFFFRPSS